MRLVTNALYDRRIMPIHVWRSGDQWCARDGATGTIYKDKSLEIPWTFRKTTEQRLVSRQT
jgi:hypothetical protein